MFGSDEAPSTVRPLAQTDDLIQDLGLATLFAWMAGGDPYFLEVAQRGVLSSLQDPDTIVYRQEVLADCLAHPEVVRRIYDLTLETLSQARQIWRGSFPDSRLSGSVSLLEILVAGLKGLRSVVGEAGDTFASEGFTSFFATLAKELTDEY
ncbi:MAG: MutS-related protein, partial [Actinomycetota bacterium]